MSDVRIYQAADGGEISITNGEPLTDEGLESAAYLSCFGGNQDDSGLTDGEPHQWWANVEEPVRERRLRSQLQSVLRGMPCTPFNLRRAEDAAMSDLEWMVTELQAKVTVEASIPAVEWINIHVTIAIGDTKDNFDFGSRWASQ